MLCFVWPDAVRMARLLPSLLLADEYFFLECFELIEEHFDFVFLISKDVLSLRLHNNILKVKSALFECCLLRWLADGVSTQYLHYHLLAQAIWILTLLLEEVQGLDLWMVALLTNAEKHVKSVSVLVGDKTAAGTTQTRQAVTVLDHYELICLDSVKSKLSFCPISRHNDDGMLAVSADSRVDARWRYAAWNNFVQNWNILIEFELHHTIFNAILIGPSKNIQSFFFFIIWVVERINLSLLEVCKHTVSA